MNYKEIAEYIIKNGLEAGVRGIYEDEKYEVGDYTRVSYHHNVEHDCSEYSLHGEDGETLGGTCAIEILGKDGEPRLNREFDDDYEDENYVNLIIENIKQAVEMNKAYGDGRQIIIVGKGRDENLVSDEQEIIIKDAKVLAFV